MEYDISLREILRIVRRRIWLIAAAVVLCGGVGLVALLAIKPVYSASALVMVDPSQKDLLDPGQASAGFSDSARVDSEVQLVDSDTNMLLVARDLDLASDPEFGVTVGLTDLVKAFLKVGDSTTLTAEQAVQVVTAKLKGAVGVQRRGLTFLIDVSARSARPEFAAKLANAIAKTYIDQQLQSKVNGTLASRNIIQARVQGASDAVAESENAFDRFIDDNLASISASTGRMDLVQLRDEITKLAQTKTSESSQVEVTQAALAQRDWAAIASTLGDEAIANLNKQRADLLSSLADVPDQSDAAVNLRGELADLEGKLQRDTTKVIATLQSSVADSQARMVELRNQLRTDVLGSNLPAETLTQLYELQKSAEIARNQYQTLLSRQADLENQAYLQVPDSRIAAEAIPPNVPTFPNPRLFLGLALAAGLGFGLVLAFLVENFIGGFSTEEQAQNILRSPVIATLPRQRSGKRRVGGGDGVADIIVAAPLSVFAESIRRVRIGIDQAVSRKRLEIGEDPGSSRTILVTSTAPKEGKTTIALSLARAYALSGRSTLLIDCDLRNPSLHKYLAGEQPHGLLEYLGGGADRPELGSIMMTDADSGAQLILGSRRRNDRPTDQFIAGPAFANIIKAAEKSFEVVILDGPPVGPLVDPLYLVGLVDVVAFVVRWGKTPQQQVRKSVAQLKSAAPPNVDLLLVINSQDGSNAAYTGRYGSYYEETGEPAASQPAG